MSALREILATFDIIVNDGALDAANKRLDSFVDKLKGAAAAFGEFKLVKSIVEFGEGIAEAARKAEFGAARIGMGVDEYQKLAQVAENYGLTTEQLQISTRMFERALSDTGGTMGHFDSHTHFARDALKNLNLDVHQFKGQQLDQILPVVADAFAGITDPIERTAIALRLFGHRGLAILPMLTRGGENLRREFATMVPIFEQATIESADNATIATKGLSRAWDNLIDNSFGKAVLDAMTWVSRKLTDIVLWVKNLAKNSEIGKGVLAALGIAMVIAAGMIIAAWWPVLLPILAIIAAFAALALIIDDLIVFMEGGDSELGNLLDRIFGEGAAAKTRKFLEELWEEFKAFFAKLQDESFQELLKGMEEFVTGLRDTFKEIKEDIAWIETHWKAMAEGFDNIAHFFGGGSTEGKATTTLKGALAPGSAFINTVAPPPIMENLSGPPTAAQVGTYGEKNANGLNFIINGGIDSNELARKITKTVDEHGQSRLDGILRDALGAVGGSK